jgi:hypothetical protein
LLNSNSDRLKLYMQFNCIKIVKLVNLVDFIGQPGLLKLIN